METHGPLGTLWVSLGLVAFYIALTWLQVVLGFLAGPLLMVPATWLLDWRKRRKGELPPRDSEVSPYQG